MSRHYVGFSLLFLCIKFLAHLAGIQTPETTCTETSLASHNRETSALRCLSVPRGRAACLCRAWGRAMKGMGRGQTGRAKGTFLLWMWMWLGLLLVKGQILSNLKASTLCFCLCFDCQEIYYSVQRLHWSCMCACRAAGRCPRCLCSGEVFVLQRSFGVQ